MILLGFVPPCQPSLYTGLAAAPKTRDLWRSCCASLGTKRRSVGDNFA